MDSNENRLLEELKSITPGAYGEAICRFTLLSVIEAVLNYCHIEEIPQKLEFTVIRMAVDVLRKEQYQDITAVPTVVTDIKVGDTSTSFAPLSDTAKNSLVSDYKKQLNRFRKVT